MGLNFTIKTTSMVFEVVALVIRQCALKNCLWQILFWVVDGESPLRGDSSFFLSCLA